MNAYLAHQQKSGGRINRLTHNALNPDTEVKKEHRLALRAWLLGVATQKAPDDHAPNDAGDIAPRFNSRQLLLATTANPVTPFVGLASLIEFFNTL